MTEPSQNELIERRLNELYEIIGDKLIATLALYIENSGINLSNLEKAFEAQNLQQLADISHQMKGSSANLGAQNFSKLCGQLEVLSRQTSDFNEIDKILSMIRVQNSAIIEVLTKYLTSI